MTLREKYLSAVKEASKPQKQLVSKSALGPDVVALRDANGMIVGFSTVEDIPVGHPDHPNFKQDVAKSAAGAPADPNAVFDSLFFGETDGQSSGRTVSIPNKVVAAKSADDVEDNSCLDSMVPATFRQWPI